MFLCDALFFGWGGVVGAGDGEAVQRLMGSEGFQAQYCVLGILGL